MAMLAPAMPTVNKPFPHRPHEKTWPLYNAVVARPLPAKEIANSPRAQEALRKEYDAQRTKGVWDETKVEEWSTVSARARKQGKTVHVGLVFGIAVIKNEELPEGHKDRKYKIRFVFQ